MNAANCSTNSHSALPPEPNTVFLTRDALSKRWCITTRTIDRQRTLGLLPWRDLSNGIGKRPIVRFKLSDIEEYEKKVLQAPHEREG